MATKPQREKPYKILSIDPWLMPYRRDIQLRMQRYTDIRKVLLRDQADLSSMANGYMYYGFHREENGWVYREWAPGADAMHLIGDFNGWNRTAHPMVREDEGNWVLHLPGADALKHKQRVKVSVTHAGQTTDHIPLYIERAVQDKDTMQFCGEIWAPEKPFRWTDGGYRHRKISPLFIYECHIGMAQEEGKVGTYREFADIILPRIKEAGYNTIQLMAIQEHPLYASFGYQVTNFFAASSWYGEPDDLKYLINTAHAMDMYVLLDLVHSHASGNAFEGLNLFDGTETQFFKPGPAGNHPAWGTKLFNYGKHEVIHFLLSNIKYWLDVYHFDGFRFDGVTSMLYHDHGLGNAFDGYDKYFSLNTDVEAVTYLQLATELMHAVNPFAVAIAEDMSGMPGLAIPIRYGGLGFDYRLSMGVPDFWIKMVGKTRDEDIDIRRMWHELTTHRPREMRIGYAESHDQALVGDKTLIFWLADAEMYTGMDKAYHSLTIDRAIALHKMIRFATLALACDGYLNFMGNEFGHPEWIDFPREGNGFSFHYARRQWSLGDNGFLKYQWLRDFDRAMLKFARKYRVVLKRDLQNLWIDQERKILAFSKGELVYLFNFSAKSSADFFLPTHATGAGKYQVIFSTDSAAFGGFENVSLETVYETNDIKDRGLGFFIYSPSRTAMVLKRISGT